MHQATGIVQLFSILNKVEDLAGFRQLQTSLALANLVFDLGYALNALQCGWGECLNPVVFSLLTKACSMVEGLQQAVQCARSESCVSFGPRGRRVASETWRELVINS